METFDALVVGVGGVGSATLYHLARRGLRVAGLEQFGVGHDRGSSHGATRIFRRAYFEHPDYVPLANRARQLWEELQREAQLELLRPTGLLLAGTADGAIIPGVQRAAAAHALPIEPIAPADARCRGFQLPAGLQLLYERDAAILWVERCVEAHVRMAESLGARVVTGCTVRDWSAGGDSVVVRTDQGDYAAARLVICAGAWSAAVLRGLRIPLEVRRKVLIWLPEFGDGQRLENGFPIFGFEVSGDFYYGFPAVDARGIKLAQHFGGEAVPDANALDRTLRPDDAAPLLAFAKQFLPGVGERVGGHSVCMYTMTPDEHFVIDRHPQHANVAFAAGLSGHGFKFAPILGAALADLATQGVTDVPIGFLRADRFE